MKKTLLTLKVHIYAMYIHFFICYIIYIKIDSIFRSSNVSGKFVFWPEGTDQSIIDCYPPKDELSYVKMLNAVLPDSISVTAWAPVPRDFSARHACNMRIYKYTMPRANLDLSAMQKACQLLVGRYDFRNFCQVDMNESRVNMSYVRDIFDATIESIGRLALYIISMKKCRNIEYCVIIGFISRFDSYDMEWTYDDYAMKKTISSLQATLAGMLTKSRIVENMLTEAANTPVGSLVDLDKGLLEFTQV
uniref:tRNA pseudouridine(38-40) synthase n=1 Tax=Heterorhabditis bacteriophora TaxID=37862 RepID=A0A1I7XTY0_HETBA